MTVCATLGCSTPLARGNKHGLCVSCYAATRAAESARAAKYCECGTRIHKTTYQCKLCYLASPRGETAIREVPNPADTAAASSAALLRRHLITGKHWITDPTRFAAACESVGLAA